MSRIVGIGAKKKAEKTYTAKEFKLAVEKASKEIIDELEATKAELNEANVKIQELTAELEATKADNGANKGTENN